MTPHKVNAIDVHVAGEAGRVLMDGHLWVKGDDMSARLRYCRENLQWLRKLVLKEPRGYPGLLGVMVLPPVNPGNDFGVIILEQADFAPMSGANLMCAVTALVETGRVPVHGPVVQLRVDTASGAVDVTAEISDGRVVEVTIENVPAFAVAIDHPLQLPYYGEVPVDIVFGGQYYVQAPAEALGLELVPEAAQDIIHAAGTLLEGARAQFSVAHPTQSSLNRIDLPMIHAESSTPGVSGKNSVVMPHGSAILDDSDTWKGGTLDRSPGGTGTCARMAAKHARGELGLGDPFIHESILETTFTGYLRGVSKVGEYSAVLPAVSGRGWITGFHQFVVSPDDPFPNGYTLADIWGGTVPAR